MIISNLLHNWKRHFVLKKIIFLIFFDFTHFQIEDKPYLSVFLYPNRGMDLVPCDHTTREPVSVKWLGGKSLRYGLLSGQAMN
jgi:hypothetical protein